MPIVVEPLVVSCKFAIVALVAVDANAVEAVGSEQQLRAELKRQVFALNVKLPSYSQIGICELRTGHLRRLPSRASSDFVQLISDVLYVVRMSLQILLEK